MIVPYASRTVIADQKFQNHGNILWICIAWFIVAVYVDDVHRCMWRNERLGGAVSSFNKELKASAKEYFKQEFK